MSYTELSQPPNDLEFEIQDGKLIIGFTCPRCDTKQEHVVNVKNLEHGFTAWCFSRKCAMQDERDGYILRMNVRWHASVLGLNDRPLHEEG